VIAIQNVVLRRCRRPRATARWARLEAGVAFARRATGALGLVLLPARWLVLVLLIG
jgi:hypothetical protein